MHDDVVFLDGLEVRPEHAVVSVYDRAFLRGDSVFEVMRVYDGRALGLAHHLERLARSASLVGIAPRDGETENDARRALARFGVRDGSLRVMWTGGTGAELYARGRVGHRLIVVRAIEHADFASPVRFALNDAPRVLARERTPKYGNYYERLVALAGAAELGACEAILSDEGARIVEGATSNVFARFGRRIVTPPVSSGILEGVTRAYALAHAKARGDTVELRPIERHEVGEADEMFVTSSLREALACDELVDEGGQVLARPPSRTWSTEFRSTLRERARIELEL